ncbi:MAG: hypothetical protein IJF84_13235 [Thermoguttaceae bacterium]|nr:hypothetical protein [Thermoguttaceae bacterium]
MAGYQSSATIKMEVPDFTQFAYYTRDDGLKKKIMRLWAKRLRAFLLREFDTNARGGGKWEPLKRPRPEPRTDISTENAEQVSISKHFSSQSILIDTGALRMAINPTGHNAGGLEEIKSEGLGFKTTLSVGWGGEDKHPPREGSTVNPHITIGELAVIHHFGNSNLPARPLLVQPDTPTVAGLTTIAEKEIYEFAVRKITGK